MDELVVVSVVTVDASVVDEVVIEVDDEVVIGGGVDWSSLVAQQ